MMQDQATELRNLVLRYSREQARDAGPPPRLLVLSGGKRGVGVTTIAVHLAVAAAEQGSRVVLVDGDWEHPDVARRCGLEQAGGIAEITAARKSIHEVLLRGPSGTQLVPGGSTATSVLFDEPAQRRLLSQISTLGRHADLVILDAGGGANETVRRFWDAADEVLLATTPDPLAVMDAYATIKSMSGKEGQRNLRLVVNCVDDDPLGASVYRRIDQSCQRFLGVSVGWAGQIPWDSQLAAPVGGEPQSGSTLGPPAAVAFRQLLASIEPPRKAVA